MFYEYVDRAIYQSSSFALELGRGGERLFGLTRAPLPMGVKFGVAIGSSNESATASLPLYNGVFGLNMAANNVLRFSPPLLSAGVGCASVNLSALRPTERFVNKLDESTEPNMVPLSRDGENEGIDWDIADPSKEEAPGMEPNSL